MSGKRLTREARRERILAAAAGVFASAGYDAAGMREVAAAAGISTPVLYDHFPAKARLYAALLESEVDDLLAGWAALPPSDDPEVLLRSRVSAIFAWLEAHERGWRMIFAEPPSDPAVASVHRRGQERATANLAALFHGVPLDLTARIPRPLADEVLAEACKSALNGVATWWWDHRDVPREEVVALTADLLWRGLGKLTEGER
ncbi:TetR/AcrR family transcriptional regulator [Amycolatopsis sp. OK19-0408]|uniref:TetR/AcrR family transcriptional regulator n=1 Tax=Amycolatopsis iheyensis TaxID=2945988 RepID=A0A9X2SNB4_9PSEU|nr:TetR/AcrR family transcriptional regulator [Amycolatopsis iheyensis]MCR6486355.1 TetR/AcrR family transcriptional regulator [Amycolatopsis iheyensis]